MTPFTPFPHSSKYVHVALAAGERTYQRACQSAGVCGENWRVKSYWDREGGTESEWKVKLSESVMLDKPGLCCVYFTQLAINNAAVTATATETPNGFLEAHLKGPLENYYRIIMNFCPLFGL